MWVVRLRSPFDRQKFPSAASDALRQAARAELAQLLDRALKPRVEARAEQAAQVKPTP
jgi:ribonuclease P protein component